MKNFFALPQIRATGQPVDFSPINNALETVRDQNNQNALMDMRREEQTYQRGRDQKQDARQEQFDQMRVAESLAKRADAIGRLPLEQRGPAWQQHLSAHKRYFPNDTIDPEDMDPIQGPQRYAAAFGGIARDPREDRLMDLKVAQAQKDLNRPTADDLPSAVQEYEYAKRLPPEEYQRFMALKRANPLDRAYANQYSQQVLSGGNIDATKNISQLQDVQSRLESGKENLTGPMLGMVPESIKSFTNPESIAVQDQVEEVVQRNLREILGAQFTQKEGDRLIARAFNPRLEEKENAKRLARLTTAMQEALRSRQEAAAYFQQNGTMRGFQGRTQWSVADFEKAMEGNTDQQLPTISDPAQARALPKGTRFKTPDGRVMEVP